MNIDFKLLGASQMRKTIDKLAKVTGMTAEEGVKTIAMSTARALAIKIQPFGISNQYKGKKFEASIRRQVETAWFGVNLGAYPATSDMKQAHYQARVRGKVPVRKFRKQKGKPWLGLISNEAKNAYIKTQVKKAGRAKAAYIDAANGLAIRSYGKRGGTQKISGVAPWIKDNVGEGWGNHAILGRELRALVELENKTPYVSFITRDADVKRALTEGRKNGLKRMEIVIAAELKKLRP